ncbi:TPA: hypothetical protein DEP21_03140 [Patescibacteria group bacterium]|nr:hypothetical protein [Candidatus Gracilibacteria bacterium]
MYLSEFQKIFHKNSHYSGKIHKSLYMIYIEVFNIIDKLYLVFFEKIAISILQKKTKKNGKF